MHAWSYAYRVFTRTIQYIINAFGSTTIMLKFVNHQVGTYYKFNNDIIVGIIWV